MKIKRFFAKDMRTALQDVKNELGVDAVIMSNTKTADGIEIVAAVDDDNDAQIKPAQSSTQPPQHASAGFQSTQPEHVRKPSFSQPDFQTPLNEPSISRQDAYSSALDSRFESNNNSEHLSESEVADSLKALLQRQNKTINEKVDRAQAALDAQAKLEAHARAHPRQTHSTQRPLAPQEQVKSSPSQPLYDTFASQQQAVQQEQNEASLQQQAEMKAMKDEMAEMRKLMEHQVSGLMWQEMARREPMRAYLVDRLSKLGIANEVADQVASFIPEELDQQEAWDNAMELLTGQLNVTNNDILRRGGFVALLGPTGVGKTTTIAKLAAHFAQQHGSDQVAMVTTDSFRIGAHEQLQTYARILGCPCKLVHNKDELSDTLYQLRNRKLVLIDTAGVGQRDMSLAAHLDTLMTTSAVKIRSYLVLQATAQRRVMQEAIDRFKQIPITGCIFSKIDECMSLGELISVSIQNAIPIGYLSEGQRVPEDLRVAESDYLVKKATQLMNERTISQPNWFTDDSIQPINK